MRKSRLGFKSIRDKGARFARHYFDVVTHPIRRAAAEPIRFAASPGPLGVEIYTEVIEMHYDYMFGSSPTSRKAMKIVREEADRYIEQPEETSSDVSWYFN
jgi:hypothetical protein